MTEVPLATYVTAPGDRWRRKVDLKQALARGPRPFFRGDSMKKIWAAVAALAMLGMHGTAETAAPRERVSRPASAVAVAEAPSLRGSTLYIYTFIDVRQREFGPKVIDAFDTQLVSRFGAVAVEAKVLRFGNSAFAGQKTYRGGAMSGYNVVPVERVIAANWKEERVSGARYRLIVVPSNYRISGAWQSYELHWVLFDVETGRQVWEYDYSGRHLMMLKRDENGAKRAKKFIDNAFVDLKKIGLI